MKRSILVPVAVLVTLLAAVGAVQAAKPGLPAGLGYNANTGFNTITLDSGNVPTVIASLTLPVNSHFMVSATVDVFNEDQGTETGITCQILHGDTQVDVTANTIPPATADHNTGLRYALSGAIDRASDAGALAVQLVCSSSNGGFASDAQLNAISVSSLTVQ
jgi:hypothetical protein